MEAELPIEAPIIKALIDLLSALLRRVAGTALARKGNRRAAQLISEAIRELLELNPDFICADVLIRQAEELLAEPDENLEKAKAMLNRLAELELKARTMLAAPEPGEAMLRMLDEVRPDLVERWSHPSAAQRKLLAATHRLIRDDAEYFESHLREAEGMLALEELERFLEQLQTLRNETIALMAMATFDGPRGHGTLNTMGDLCTLSLGPPPTEDEAEGAEWYWGVVNWSTLVGVYQRVLPDLQMQERSETRLCLKERAEERKPIWMLTVEKFHR